ncbi:MAG: DUF3887 domain-containing protein [Verrucomicrobiota bacterium]|jgi:pimeloyl-ACP methyl ester carboxylesterase
MTIHPDHLCQEASSTGTCKPRSARQPLFPLLTVIVALIAIAGNADLSLQAETSPKADNPAATDAIQNPLAIAQNFVALLATNDFSGPTEYYDATMKTALPAEKLKAAWLGLLEEVGPFQKVEHVQTDPLPGCLIVYVTCQFEKQLIAVKVVLDNPGPTNGFLLGAPASYWLDLKNYHPAAAAKQLAMPLLLLQGESDCQVSFKADFPLWRQALADGKKATFKSYPALNHFFMRVNSPSTGAEYKTAGHVAGDVVRDIADWVLANR